MPKKFYSKHEKDAIIYRTKVTSIEFLNKDLGPDKKLKNVFYVEPWDDGADIMCVIWGYKNLNVGDEIEIQGRLNDARIFLAWSLHILKRAEKNEV